MELLNKKVVNVFGRNNYLLGEDEDGIRYYLEESSFDCGWYWGIGYIETFTNNRQPTRSVDIMSHEHFDNKFMRGGYVDGYEKFFKKSTLDRHQIYKLFELMEVAYTLSHMAGISETSPNRENDGSCYDYLKNQTEYLNIIKVKLPAVLADIYNLLGGNLTKEYFSKKAIYKDE